MDKAVFEDYRKNRYGEQMKYYADSSRDNRDKYKKFQWTLIILSAITPVLAALDGLHFWNTPDALALNTKIIVVIVSSIVAILTTGLKTFNYYENWVNYRNTREDLKREIYYYNFGIGPYAEAGIDKESFFVSRVESLLDKEHAQWPASKKLKDQLQNHDAANTTPPDNGAGNTGLISPATDPNGENPEANEEEEK